MIYKKISTVFLKEVHTIVSINLWIVFISLHWEDMRFTGGWLRLFSSSKGLSCKHKNAPKIFSERNGFVKSVTIGNLYIKVTK